MPAIHLLTNPESILENDNENYYFDGGRIATALNTSVSNLIDFSNADDERMVSYIQDPDHEISKAIVTFAAKAWETYQTYRKTGRDLKNIYFCFADAGSLGLVSYYIVSGIIQKFRHSPYNAHGLSSADFAPFIADLQALLQGDEDEEEENEDEDDSATSSVSLFGDDEENDEEEDEFGNGCDNEDEDDYTEMYDDGNGGADDDDDNEEEEVSTRKRVTEHFRMPTENYTPWFTHERITQIMSSKTQMSTIKNTNTLKGSSYTTVSTPIPLLEREEQTFHLMTSGNNASALNYTISRSGK